MTDPVQAFLRRNTFYCEALCARLKPEECCARQKRKAELKAIPGRKLIFANNPPDLFCRSGKCKQGKEQKKKQRELKKRLKLKRQMQRQSARENRASP